MSKKRFIREFDGGAIVFSPGWVEPPRHVAKLCAATPSCMRSHTDSSHTDTSHTDSFHTDSSHTEDLIQIDLIQIDLIQIDLITSYR